jgi:hypothetical protein
VGDSQREQIGFQRGYAAGSRDELGESGVWSILLEK